MMLPKNLTESDKPEDGITVELFATAWNACLREPPLFGDPISRGGFRKALAMAYIAGKNDGASTGHD